MIVVEPDRDRDGARWRLISRGQNGADVLAMAPVSPPCRAGADRGAIGSWRTAVEQLRDGDGELSIAATADGHYQWILIDPHDITVAQSPAVYRDADSCRRAFTFAQRVARTVVGVGHDVSRRNARRTTD
jgi:hypothetical protein